MKTNFSRIGKKTLSVVIAMMMVISTMLVGTVTTNAATAESDSVGASTSDWYIHYKAGSDDLGSFAHTKLDSSYQFTYTHTNNGWFYFNINQDDSNAKVNTWTKLDEISSSITIDSSVKTYNPAFESKNRDGIFFFGINLPDNPKQDITITFDPSQKKVNVSKAGSTPATNYTVTYGSNNASLGTVSATVDNGAEVEENTEVTFTANPIGSNVFKGWYSDSSCNTEISGAINTTYTTAITKNTTVYAKFEASSTPTATYYIGGRFRVKDSSGNVHTTLDSGSYSGDWNPSCTDSYFTFKENPSVSGEYILETNMTTKDLSATVGTKNYNPYFIIHKGEGTSDFYGREYNASSTPSNRFHECQIYTDENIKTLDSCKNGSNAKEDQFLLFTDAAGAYEDNGNVTLHFNPSTRQFWYTTETPLATGDFTIEDKTDTNGTLTFSAPGRTAGKANAGDVVTVTANPSKYFECTGITVTYTELPSKAKKTITPSGSGNSYTFTVPAGLTKDNVKDATISVKGTFALTSNGKLDYVKAQGEGLYIDVAPSENDTTATLIKWNNYKGSSHDTTNPYTFYVPKNVNLSNAVIYNTTGSTVTIGSKSINNNEKSEGVTLAIGNNSITGHSSVTNVKVMQGSTDAMFLSTSGNLPTAIASVASNGAYTVNTEDTAKAYKKVINFAGGSCKTMNNDTSVAEADRFSVAMGLSSIKGRGNSSWKASGEIFGKYAFNMKLNSKTNLLGMDKSESSGAKSWCLLANNADQSMLRNAMTYQLAAQIGLLYSPEFRFVDIYDNSEYMGSYLVTEKVDVGDSKLIKGKSFDDINEKIAGTVDETKSFENGAAESLKTKYEYNGQQYVMRYATVTSDATLHSQIPYNQQGKYLLEFEISERVNDEPCYFVSPHGQNVVVKSPEFATKEQVEYIAKKYAAMEEIAFKSGATKEELSSAMDVESFAKMYLIQEFSSNLDSASTSYYVTLDCSKNDANGNGAVFVANPVWDYDWAYGQYDNAEVYKPKKDISDSVLKTANPAAWVAKDKAMDDSKDSSKGRSIQSQLAGTNEAFKAEIRKQWESNSSTGFYKNIKTYYEGENNQLDTWYNAIKASVDMNEERWHFIETNPLKTAGWGSNNAITSDGSGFDGAVKYLKNDWTSKRAAWLNTQFQTTEYAAFVPVAPTAAAYTADGTQTLDSVPQGTPFIIKATSTDSDVVFRLYKDSTMVEERADGEFIIQTKEITPDTSLTYTVKAVYKTVNNTTTESAASDPAINVKVTTNSDTKTVTIYFKSASASVYVPSLSIDGGNASVMSRNKIGTENSTYFGSNYSGSLKFYWFYTTVTLDTTKTHTLRFTTKENLVDASMNLMLNTYDTYYFAVDNLMGGDTTLVNLTEEPEYIRNWHISATHMVHSEPVVSDPGYNDNSIGFTWVKGEDGKYGEYAMGSIVKKNENSTQNVNLTNLSSLAALSTVNPKSALTALSAGPYFTIKSATLAQQITAGAVNVSELQYQLLDVNLDGVVNVKDATMMQKALAKF